MNPLGLPGGLRWLIAGTATILMTGFAVTLVLATITAGEGGSGATSVLQGAIIGCQSATAPASPSPSPVGRGKPAATAAPRPTATPPTATAPAAPTVTVADIPPRYLALYRQAGARYGVDWTLLAAIGSVESDHGRNATPSSAGALGPMQFLPSTWAIYGVDGDGDGVKDINDPVDAIPATANMLRADGVNHDQYHALWLYNHADSYVRLVQQRARAYAAAAKTAGLPPLTTTTPADDTATCPPALTAWLAQITAPTGGQGSLPPGTPALISKVIAFALAQRGKPYQWGSSGPDSFDCSGLLYAAYHRAGVDIPRTTFVQWQQLPHVTGPEQPGDLVFFNSGPGSSVGHPGHVGLVLGGGQMVVAPHSGAVVQLQSYRGRADLVGFARPTGPAGGPHAP